MKEQREKKMCFKQRIVIVALCLGFITGIPVLSAFAVDDPADFGDEAETPSYANPAQAQHAANLATAAASQPDENTAEALSAVEQAEADLAEAELNGTQEEINAARENLTEAQETYSDLIADKTGVLSQEIADMRNVGMGWGQIANELGVHPGLLGLGHTKKGKGQGDDEGDMDEVTEATARNTHSGWSRGHGIGLNAGVQSTDKTKGGLAFGHANKGTKKGEKGSRSDISGASGLSGNKGGANNGDSNGGGSGNDKGVAGNDGSPGNSGNAGGNGGSSDKGNNKGGNSDHGKGGGKGNK